MSRLRRLIQLLSLAAFCGLLVSAALSRTLGPGLGFGRDWPFDFFLRLDPLIFAGTAISARMLIIAFIPAVIVLALGPFLGRAFCGWVCPLGASVDISDKALADKGKRRDKTAPARWRRWKYFLLALVLAAALAGVSLVFLFSPLALATRFYGLVLWPVAALIGETAFSALQPLAESWGLTGLALVSLPSPVFATAWLGFILVGLILAGAKLAPRLWCRYLCPAGALQALTAFKPLIRRRVSDKCTDCGRCQRACPMAAIDSDPRRTSHAECVSCQRCSAVCPEKAIHFRPKAVAANAVAPLSVTRRDFVLGAASGLSLAALDLTSLTSLRGGTGVGRVRPQGLIRPPGTLPEAAFLARCVGCGNCAAACPTNTIQPLWFQAGLTGLFSPGLTARRGPCDPHCQACARACPTGAINRLAPQVRLWAKTGTATIDRRRCLAWEQNKKCMVCDEVCPFGAIHFESTGEAEVTVPFVRENRCAGCGYCEHYCPVQNKAAIFVTALGELRLPQGAAYEAAARKQGLDLRLKPLDGYGAARETDKYSGQGPAPGFTD